MSWKHAKIAVKAPLAVLSKASDAAKTSGDFRGLILPLSCAHGTNRTIRPLCFLQPRFAFIKSRAPDILE
jgi:hypothetical protein